MKQSLFNHLNKYIAFLLILFFGNIAVDAQLVSTIAGNYAKSSGYGGDGTNALNLHILPTGVVSDASGNIYFINGNAVRKLKLSNNSVSTVVGASVSGFSGDGGNANTALLSSPSSLAFDAAYANLYIADQGNQRIRKIVISTNNISTVAGNGTVGFAGDGTAATAAQLNNPSGIAIDAVGNIFISDKTNNRIRKITAATGKIATDRKSTRLNSSHPRLSRMPSSA